MTIKTLSGKKFKLSQEDRAFIYQKASELQVPVIVVMDQNKEKYSITFIIDPNKHTNLQVTAEGTSIIDACMKVKREAQKKISLTSFDLHNKNDTEREILIELMKNHIRIH